MKNLILALILIPALAACKSAYFGDDVSDEATLAAGTSVVDDEAGRVRDNVQENERDNDQVQGGS
jgi:hypothetical protein